MTNKHLLPKTNSKEIAGSINYEGKEYAISKTLTTKGSLDVLFITLKDKVKTLTPLKDEWDKHDLIAKYPERGERTISCGFPSDGTNFSTADVTMSRGEILSTWLYKPENSSDKKEKLGEDALKLLKN